MAASATSPHSPDVRMDRQAIVLIALWAISILAAFVACSFGRYAIHTMSGDWANEMAMIEADYHNATLPHEQPIVIDYSLHYPHWGFALVASTAARFRLNPLRSMQVWTIAWLISGCFLLAVRLASISKDRPPLGTMILTALYLAVCAYIGFGWRGQVEGNFFFAQLSATTLALAGLVALQFCAWQENLTSLFIVLWGAIVLPNFHLVPAVWFTLAGIIILLSRTTNLRASLLNSVLVGLIAASSWILQGSSSSMASLANNNGSFITRLGQLADQGKGVAVGLCAVLVLMLFALFRLLRRLPYAKLRPSLVPFAGLIAAIVLISLQSAVYVMLHQGSIYAILKYSYLLAGEGAVLLISMRWRASSGSERLLLRNPALATVACVILLFCAQLPFIPTPDDQTALMNLRARLLRVQGQFTPEHRVYPQFPDMDYDRNYYLATAIMRIPTDDRTIKWLLRGAVGEEAFDWPAKNQIAVRNAQFESGALAPWTPYGTLESSISSERFHNGKFGLAEAQGTGSVYQDITGLQPGAEYTISAWISANPGTTATAQIAAYETDAKGATASAAVRPTPEWQMITYRVKLVSHSWLRIHLCRNAGNGTVFWDDVQVAQNVQ